MPFCHHCGSPIDKGKIFCDFIGTLVNGDVPVTPLSALSLKGRPPAAHLLVPSTKPMQSLSGPKRVIPSSLLVPGLIGIILVVAAAAFFAFSGSPLSSGVKNSTNVSQGSGTAPVNDQCSADLSLCSGTCVNLQTDQDNCGACGFSVPYGETCRNGQFSSPAGQNPAGSVATSAPAAVPQGTCPSGRSSCNGTCRDLVNDAANCGSCGNSCPSGQDCENGRCLLPVTSVPVMSTSPALTITPELSCSHDQIPCGSSCVDVFSDKNNCGVCGRACGSQDKCVNARCGPACTDSGTILCDDSCVSLDTDMNNCGTCGTECKTFLPHAKGSLCSEGQCIISQCDTDYADCNKNIADGCEVNLRLDASNCGACGVKCDTGQVCYNKKCSVPIGT